MPYNSSATPRFCWKPIALAILALVLSPLVGSVGFPSANAGDKPVEGVRSVHFEFGTQTKGPDENSKIVLRGSDARYQCLVTGVDSEGYKIDIT
ncbi:MAG: hypothetical protein K9M08_19625, partial [Pirellula sp.]|nr:hypothetical protein [Pirellula sp.]